MRFSGSRPVRTSRLTPDLSLRAPRKRGEAIQKSIQLKILDCFVGLRPPRNDGRKYFRSFLFLSLLVFSFPACAQTDGTASPFSLLDGESKAGKPQYLNVTAGQSLEWHQDENVYIARGDAMATRGDLKVEADILKAHNRKREDGGREVWKLEAEGQVKITSKTHVVTGEKGVYDIDSKTASLTGGDLRYVSPTDTVTATESFEYAEAESKITATGGATARREGRRVDADRMTAFLAPNKAGGQDIERLEADGHVKIITPDDAVACDKAVYNLARNTATLSGNVRITRGANQLRGDRVEADFNTGVSRLVSTGTGRVSARIVGAPEKGAKKPGKKSGKAAKEPRSPALFAPAGP